MGGSVTNSQSKEISISLDNIVEEGLFLFEYVNKNVTLSTNGCAKVLGMHGYREPIIHATTLSQN